MLKKIIVGAFIVLVIIYTFVFGPSFNKMLTGYYDMYDALGIGEETYLHEREIPHVCEEWFDTILNCFS